MKQRHAFTTFCLVLILVSHLFVFFASFDIHYFNNQKVPMLFVMTIGQFSSVVGIFFWKKLFYYSYICQTIFGVLLFRYYFPELVYLNDELMGISFVEIVYFVLVMNLKSKNGKSTLEQLE